MKTNYVLISQGIVGKFKTVEEYQSFIKEKRDPTLFYELETYIEGETPWAMGAFKVNNDGTIGECVGARWDTSD